MSLYNHVSDKDDLLDAMVDKVTSEIDLTSDPQFWKDGLRSCLISAYGVMSNYRWLPSVWNRSLGPAKNTYHETILRLMREAKFPEELACRGFHALTMHLGGFALQAMEMPFTNKKEFVEFCNKSLEELDEAEYHYVREHIHFHLEGKDQLSDFAYMLDLILEGLERDFEKMAT